MGWWSSGTPTAASCSRRPARTRRSGAGSVPAADAVNALAVSPDGRWVVIGRENGLLLRYDAANLGNPVLLPRSSASQGQVEALAISHDSKSLVTSLVSFEERTGSQRPRVECDIELRRMPDGAVVARLAQTTNLVYACAFSPDDRRVAFAGGDTQGITITDVVDPNRPSQELAGQGSSLWDVGFSANSRAIGVARKRPDLPDPPTAYEDFDLERNRVTPFAPAELSRALTTWNGWTVRPVGPYTLDVLNAANQGHRLNLDPTLDRRWWCTSFLPPGPGHPRAHASAWDAKAEWPSIAWTTASGPVSSPGITDPSTPWPPRPTAAGWSPAPPIRPPGSGGWPTATRLRPWCPLHPGRPGTNPRLGGERRPLRLCRVERNEGG